MQLGCHVDLKIAWQRVLRHAKRRIWLDAMSRAALGGKNPGTGPRIETPPPATGPLKPLIVWPPEGLFGVLFLRLTGRAEGRAVSAD